jgi:hypothetical protein
MIDVENKIEIKKGDWISRTSYFEVIREMPNQSFLIKNEAGRNWVVDEAVLLGENITSANWYEKEEKVTMTFLAGYITNQVYRDVFTVSFIKSNGEERLLTGYKLSTEHNLGRSLVQDVKSGPRQVDHRTIQYLIHRGTKYILK